jgi:hypothetical protein
MVCSPRQVTTRKGVRLLIRTNWIRTPALLAQAVLALYCVYRGVSVAAENALPKRCSRGVSGANDSRRTRDENR